MSILIGNLDLSIYVGMDIVMYNILRITDICTCMKVFVRVLVYKQLFGIYSIEGPDVGFMRGGSIYSYIQKKRERGRERERERERERKREKEREREGETEREPVE